jgi:chaperonin GroEL
VGGKGDKKTIEGRISQIKAQIQKTDSEFDKEKLQERLGKLSGGVAVIKVGAPTESAQKELKQRVEDAVAATRAAMEEGIVPGGGIAFFNVQLEVGASVREDLKSVVEGAKFILGKALVAPLFSIITNSGESKNVMEKLVEEKKKLASEGKKEQCTWLGFNAVTNKIGDLKEAGIIDPLKVSKTAFVNAISVAANYLTVGAAITEIPEKKDKGGMPPMGGMEDY